MKNYNANPRPYGRGFFLYRNKSNTTFLKGEQGKGKTFLRVFLHKLGRLTLTRGLIIDPLKKLVRFFIQLKNGR